MTTSSRPPKGVARLPLSAREVGCPSLPKLVPAAPASEREHTKPRDTGLWSCVRPDKVLRDQAAPGVPPHLPRLDLGRGRCDSNSVHPTSTSSRKGDEGVDKEWGRSATAQLVQGIDAELKVLGLANQKPCRERLTVFEAAFTQAIDMLPSFRSLLVRVKREYDDLIEKLQKDSDALAPMETRLQVLKAESVSFVGESATQFQRENMRVQGQLHSLQEAHSQLQEQYNKIEVQYQEQSEAHRQLKAVSDESHNQNYDLVKMFNATVQAYDESKTKERQAQQALSRCSRDLKSAEGQIRTLEHQLQLDSHKMVTMVSGEDAQALRDRIKEQTKQFNDLQELYRQKCRDYEGTVLLYSKLADQNIDAKSIIRPLTPRPDWRYCQGLTDPEQKDTVQKTENAQSLLEHILTRSRTLLYAYGLWSAAEKSSVAQEYAVHPLSPAPVLSELRASGEGQNAESVSEPVEGSGGVGASGDKPDRLSTACAADLMTAAEVISSPEELYGEEWFEPCTDLSKHMVLQHSERIRNLRFSRRASYDFMMGVIQLRISARECLRPFLESMISMIPSNLYEPQDRTQFILSHLSAVKRYSSEPDFLAFQLLIQGKITDYIVLDGRNLCGELLRHFRSMDQSDSKTMTKQNFFYQLQGLLPNKQKKLWQDLQHYLPAGGPDFSVCYEWLMVDDLYVPSPVVFGMRMQHLEETLDLLQKLEQVVRAEAKDGVVKYEDVAHALGKEASFYTIQDEDLARGFDVSIRQTRMDTEQNVDVFLQNLRNGPIFPAILKDNEDSPLQPGPADEDP